MVQFNFSERTIKAKVVYYGPAQSGKTTNLEQIHRISDPAGTNRLISLNTAHDRTLFFDLLPFSLGAVAGYDFKIQLYTVPGQVQYNATRRVVLAGADAVVFVADSRRSLSDENQSAFENMKVNLLANRLPPEKVPLIIQYNKRDLPDAVSEAELNRTLNPWARRTFLAVAADAGAISEELLHRSIRSNVELAEALAALVRDVNLGLASILSHAELLLLYREDAREKRAAAIGNIQQEAARLRRIIQGLGRAGASGGDVPLPQAAAAPPAAPAAPAAVAPPAAGPAREAARPAPPAVRPVVPAAPGEVTISRGDLAVLLQEVMRG